MEEKTMKIKRIICAMLLIVCVLASCVTLPTFAAEFADLDNKNSAYTAVNVLSNLGVINGYEEDGAFKFKPDNNVTRAEFTAMLLRTRGLGKIGSLELENPPFPDVASPDVSWAIGNIRTAREMNIINGYDDGTFKPNNNVLYEEAIKMVVCALGYGEFGVDGNEWYSKYLTSATTLGILDNTGGSIGAPATRATIASMLYNCLEVKLAENNTITDKTVLEADLQLSKKVGVIASNSETGLETQDPNLRDNEIQIRALNDAEDAYETLTYKVENAAEYADMLGNQITFYYKDDRVNDIRTVVLSTVKKSKTLTINATDLEYDSCSSSAIAYYEKGKSRETVLSINPESRVIYNGKLFANTGDASKYSDFYIDETSLPTLGSITLVDQEDDGKYDIIFVDKYETYIVSAVTSSNYTIIDNVLRKGLADNKLVLNPQTSGQKIKFFDEKGNETSFSAIKKGSVVSVKKSNAGISDVQITVIVCNQTVSGSVRAINYGESVKINSTQYEYSQQAPWVTPIAGATDPLVEPTMSDEGVYYLDFNGHIIAYDKTIAASNQQYGYIVKVAYENNLEGERLVLNILTSNGKKTKYQAYDKTELNGAPINDLESLKNSLIASAETLNTADYGYNISNLEGQQLIKFSTTTYKGDTVIEKIITMTEMDSNGKVDSNKLTFYDGIKVTQPMKYYGTAKQLQKEASGGEAAKTINVSGAVIFDIPENRNDVDEYGKATLKNNTNYNVGLFDVAGTSAKVVVVYHGATPVELVNALSPVMVIKEKTQEMNPENDNQSMYKLTGYVNGSETSYWISPESETVAETLKKGDVIRVGKDKDGYRTVKAEHIVFSATEGFRDGVYVNDRDDSPAEATVSSKGGVYIDSRDDDTANQKATYPNPQYRAIWGNLFEYDDENKMVYVSTKPLTGTETYADMFQINADWFKSAKILRYNKTGGSLDIVEEALEGISANEEVFIHLSYSAVKTVIVVTNIAE